MAQGGQHKSATNPSTYLTARWVTKWGRIVWNVGGELVEGGIRTGRSGRYVRGGWVILMEGYI